jgi:ribosomal protein L24
MFLISQIGDQVKVITGPMINLTGMVISANDKQITVLPNQEDLNISLNFRPAELIKDFQLGELVRANGGRNEGKSGRIIKITDSTATILMSNQKEQFRAFVNDLVKSNEV